MSDHADERAALAAFVTRWESRQVTISADADAFVRDAAETIGMGFHPESRFGDYVNSGNDGEPTFTPEAAAMLERRIEEAYAVADRDPCAIANDVLDGSQP